MDKLRQLFVTNQVIVFALYGQVFFTLGVALAVQSMKHTRLTLGKHLRWLAAFGLSHGLVEWGYVFIPIQAGYLPFAVTEVLRWLQLALMVGSFVCLLQFGLRTHVPGGPLSRPIGAWVLTSMLITMATALGLAGEQGAEASRIGFEIWTRYLLAVPGAAASAMGIYHAAAEARGMQVPRIGRWLRISAVSLGGYALLNLVTPEHHRALAAWFNYAEVVSKVGVPAQIWRTLVGAGILYGMVRSLSLFQIETDRLLMAAEEKKLLEAQRELACMNQIAITLEQVHDPVQAMDGVLGQLLPFLGCQSGEIALRDEEGGGWRLVARMGPSTDPPGAVSPLIVRAAQSNKLEVRLLEDGRYGVSIPIHSGQRLVAAVALQCDEPIVITPQELQVVDSIGSLLGVALENSRLWAELERREADRTEWIGRIISAQEDERRHIAHELHDETVQTLVLLCRRLDVTDEAYGPLPRPVRDRLEQARRQSEELIASLRDFAHDLRPPALDDLGVASCIRRLGAEMAVRAGVSWEMEVTGPTGRLGRDTEIGLYRIAQEAIRNVEHHARARQVRVELRYGSESVTLRVSDDGRGMSPRVWQGIPAAKGRLGLVGMQERASLLGGQLTIDSQPGVGTTITVTVPRSLEAQHQGARNQVTVQVVQR